LFCGALELIKNDLEGQWPPRLLPKKRPPWDLGGPGSCIQHARATSRIELRRGDPKRGDDAANSAALRLTITSSTGMRHDERQLEVIVGEEWQETTLRSAQCFCSV
jgi:hypothetical protein